MADTPIDHVSDTAIWVATYRAIESERRDALFHDSLATILVGNRGPSIVERMRAFRLTGWSVVLRTVMIDDYIRELIAAGADTVLNLGAGLDTRPYRMALPRDLNWIEVDYPHIVALKEEKLAGNQPRCNLRRIALDLANTTDRQTFLADIATTSKSIIVLTEGVIPYLGPDQVLSLARDIRRSPSFNYWILDYYTREMHRYFKKRPRTEALRNAPFRFFIDDWEGFFTHAGFRLKEVRYYALEAQRLKRQPPVSIFTMLFWLLMPRSWREKANKQAGYAVLIPDDASDARSEDIPDDEADTVIDTPRTNA